MNILRLKYIGLISMVGTFFLVELIVGIFANSLTLQTDAFHMLSDLLALVIGFVAIMVLNRKHHRYTYGWIRAEIVAGLINSVFLLSIGFMLLIENIEKFIELSSDKNNDQLEENIDVVLIVATVGLIINIVGLLLFYNEHTHHSHGDDGNEEIVHNYAQAAILLHIIGDALGSLLVISSGIVIKYTDGDWKFYLDPIGSLLIIVFITVSSSRLLWKCVKILMHRWAGSTSDTITTDLLKIDGIANVHEFHAWALDNKVSTASLHIKLTSKKSIRKTICIIGHVKDVLHGYGIHSSTIQPEWDDVCTEPVCNSKCTEKQCCVKELDKGAG